MRGRLGQEHGFTLVEMLVAVLLLSIGIVTTIGVFTSSKKLSLSAQRHEIAIHQGQRAIEYMRSVPYDDLGLSSAPAVANRLETDTNRIGYFNGVSTTDGSLFTARSLAGVNPAVSEHFVLTDTEPTALVNPTPQAFSVGTANISGKVYRYVTWRDEDCGVNASAAQICPGYQDTKRITVAVTVDSNGSNDLTRPLWFSTIVLDPAAAPPS